MYSFTLPEPLPQKHTHAQTHKKQEKNKASTHQRISLFQSIGKFPSREQYLTLHRNQLDKQTDVCWSTEQFQPQ